ncbi:hypothetical protein AALO_G00072400 [Alosa alosa]|uniref:BTB domain-containing protein n=1 Tax=Alosa alosa TaxID=278164 RepID=A0AAV6H285_9TELE|nr:hypothetical protein AALO_G00072400 [Alosa alosa]
MFVHLPQHQSSVQIEAVLITGESLSGAAGAAGVAGGAAGVAGGAVVASAESCEMEEAVAAGGYVELDVPEFSSGVLSQLNELRLQGKLCDIIVHVQGQPFRAHKAVLAASSPYFRDHSALGTMSGLSISVIKNPEVFEQLLAFCYTGRMALRLRDIVSFLTAASFLQMQAVIDKCTQILEGLHSKIHLPPGAIAMAARASWAGGVDRATTAGRPPGGRPPARPGRGPSASSRRAGSERREGWRAVPQPHADLPAVLPALPAPGRTRGA